jgi:hypothetical protein
MKCNLGLTSWLLAGSATFCLTLAGFAGSVGAQQIPSRYAGKQVRLPAHATSSRSAVASKPAARTEPTPAVRPAGGATARVASRSSVQPASASRTFRTQQEADAYIAAEERALRARSASMQESVETLPLVDDGMTHVEGEIFANSHHGPGGGCDGNCGGDCGTQGCGGCGSCGQCCLIPCPRLSFDNFEFFAGTQGFTGPLNAGEVGSFGFHEGLNWANSLPCLPNQPLAAHLGFRATQSNFAGSALSDQDRRQFFVTGGLFRRVDWGLQGGAVLDFLHDEWYYDAIDLTQVRGELSWVFPCQDELGFWFTHGVNNTTGQTDTAATNQSLFVNPAQGWQPTDIYAAFYRRKLQDCGAEGRMFGGFTDNSDGIIGADINLPISDSFALRSGFTYLIPTEGHSTGGYAQESWNVGISLVWYPGCRTSRSQDYARPLFNVADNGSFLVDRD